MEEMKKLAKAGGYQHSTHSKGIPLRDYFAAQAMNQLVSVYDDRWTTNYASNIAKRAYIIADAMMKERGNNQPEGSVSVRQCDVFSLQKE
ncbi:MAG: hypothetical protein CVT92_02625 [Bacteroidetes bacterium HGW-Bacteroidetes-1]|jgi:hypothetical protein|nr:MAG: hypothetical protein CVT92_02625 [Bacteroidetes bacterium HGW-Bacteroidetes-1]